MIFYLWTDSNEISTAYVKFKINDTFIPEKILIFALVFEKIMREFSSLGTHKY